MVTGRGHKFSSILQRKFPKNPLTEKNFFIFSSNVTRRWPLELSELLLSLLPATCRGR